MKNARIMEKRNRDHIIVKKSRFQEMGFQKCDTVFPFRYSTSELRIIDRKSDTSFRRGKTPRFIVDVIISGVILEECLGTKEEIPSNFSKSFDIAKYEEAVVIHEFFKQLMLTKKAIISRDLRRKGFKEYESINDPVLRAI